MDTQSNEIRTPEVNNLLHVFATLDNEDDIFALLEDLFTVREIKETSKRLSVAKLLADKVSYTQIEQITGASATTIARVSKCLSYGAGGYQVAIDAMNKAVGEENGDTNETGDANQVGVANETGETNETAR